MADQNSTEYKKAIESYNTISNSGAGSLIKK